MVKQYRTATQWGVYDVEVSDQKIVAVNPIELDPAPSKIGNVLKDGIQGKTRIQQPSIREGWLKNPDNRKTGTRGEEPFVEVPWDEALDIASTEIAEVIQEHGNKSIYAGSYGWASAGRFHHAQSQLHRFLNLLGGATRAYNSYSTAAAQVILPHIVAPWHEMELSQTTWADICDGAGLVLSFGGFPLRNSQVAYGGITEHQTTPSLEQASKKNIEFISVSPLKDDMPAFLNSKWVPIRPGTDVAYMLGIAHTLVLEEKVDQKFLDSHTVGYTQFCRYLMGDHDNTPKSANWAEGICNVPADDIRTVARKMAARRSFINAAWSLQRADHGEQPYWMVVTLAAMLGHVGLRGGGFGFGYSAEGFVGSDWRRFNWATFPKGRNPAQFAIPVARVADMLLNPGMEVSYDGKQIEYPDIQLIYWAGGNPFHHHQDLNRLQTAWKKPGTVIVNEPWWTPVARQADIVFPANTALERNDICASSHDPYAHAMQQALDSQYGSRSDHDIFSGLADKLGIGELFHDNKSEMEWLEDMWQRSRSLATRSGFSLPDFDQFWSEGISKIPDPTNVSHWLEDFRKDPVSNPLATPSGKLELFSETIAAFNYLDCPGHAVWIEPFERLGGAMSDRFPLHLVTNQPGHRLHSQLDHSGYSQQHKIQGREIMRIHPDTAEQRQISDGGLVRLFNERGQCLAGARFDEGMRPDIVELPTGAWFCPMEPGQVNSLELSGNPNVLTRDKGTSSLAQGPSAHTCLVEVEAYDGDAPLPYVYGQPEFVS